jgi:signal transduction histidine kinase
MTQWVIQRHGGTIELDSTPKKGTRITLRLPAAKKP